MSSDATGGPGSLPAGGNAEVDRLTPVVYGELRRIAAAFLSREQAMDSLQPTALVHEAYLKLADQPGASWRDRNHFISLAARVMRWILIDHARTRDSLRKGGGEAVAITLTDTVQVTDAPAIELMALNDALEQLAGIDARAASAVELRFFGGLTNQEIAETQGTSLATVKRDWEFARAWLRSRLASAPDESPA